jgi:transposase-like protein
MARRGYPGELKATVMAALLQGQSIGHVAKEYKIPRGTVANWAGQVRNQNYNPVPTEKKERIGSLIIDNLEAELETMIAMQDVFKDKEWLKKQSASELAVLYGVLKDKNIRVLEALPDGEPGQEA